MAVFHILDLWPCTVRSDYIYRTMLISLIVLLNSFSVIIITNVSATFNFHRFFSTCGFSVFLATFSVPIPTFDSQGNVYCNFYVLNFNKINLSRLSLSCCVPSLFDNRISPFSDLKLLSFTTFFLLAALSFCLSISFHTNHEFKFTAQYSEPERVFFDGNLVKY